MADVLHLDYEPDLGGTWILRLQTRLRKSSAQELRSRLCRWSDFGLGDLSLAILTKLTMWPLVVERVRANLKALYEEIEADRPEAAACAQEGAGFKLADKTRIFQLLVDIDSFLFEAGSAVEITGSFVYLFRLKVLGQHLPKRMTKTKAMAELKSGLKGRGADIRWLQRLSRSRNLFIHETAPWVAFRLSPEPEIRPQLVVFKRNINDLNDAGSYFDLAELQDMFKGFQDSFRHIEDWLMDEIEDVERQLGRARAR